METKSVGNIFWITPKLNLLTTKVVEKTEENIYDPPVIKDDNIRFEVTCDGHLFSTNLQSIDKIHFKGDVLCDNIKSGNCSFVLFSNEKSILLYGDWIETLEYSCIVELNK